MPEPSHTTLIIFCTFIIVTMALAAIANRYLHRGTFLSAYFLGDREIGSWALALTMAATSASGGTFVGFPALIYSKGWVLVLWIASYMMVPLMTISVFGKRMNQISRKTGAITIPDVLRDRFASPAIGVVAALVLAAMLQANIVAQFIAGAQVLRVVANVPYEYGLAIFFVTVGAYTTYGGFRGVVWTDVFQGLVMFGGTIIMLPLAIIKAGGMTNITQSLADQSPDLVTGPGPDNFLPLAMAVSFFFYWPIGGMGQPGQLVRLMAFKESATLRRALFLICVYFTLLYTSLCFIFLAARVVLPPLADPDTVMPHMTKAAAGPILAGCLVSAPFAAIMSTVSAYLLIISSSLVRDIGQRTLFPHMSDNGVRWGSFAATAAAAAVAGIFAFRPPQFLQDIIVFAGTGLSASFLVPVAMALFWPRANAAGAVAAMITGFVTLIACYRIPQLKNLWDFHPFMWGLFCSLGVGILVTLATPRPDVSLVRRFFPLPVTTSGTLSPNTR